VSVLGSAWAWASELESRSAWAAAEPVLGSELPWAPEPVSV
jgi:hypothetical protein